MTTRKHLLEGIFTIGAPLSLATLEIFHPIPHDLFHIDLRRWMVVHYAQIGLFPLCALSVVVLTRPASGFCANLCKVAMFVFAILFVAFDTAAGVVTGALLTTAQASGQLESYRSPIMTVWTHPVIGGSGSPMFAIAGSIAWSVGAVAAAFVVRRAGSSWGPVVLLIISAFGMSIFKTHAWPGGPITFGALSLAAAWLFFSHPRKNPVTRKNNVTP